MFLVADGMPVHAQDPIATTYLALSRMVLISLACDSEDTAPSIKATSRFSMLFLVLRALIYLNSTSFTQSSKYVFNSSVRRIVLSSQQVNENQPTTSFLPVCSIAVYLVKCNIMCLAIPGKIIQIDGMQAVIEYPGESRKAFIGDDVHAGVGDFVLVQMGVVVKKVSAKEAEISLKAWQKV